MAWERLPVQARDRGAIRELGVVGEPRENSPRL